MARYYDRRYEILINDEVFIAETEGRQFRITFEIMFDGGGSISYCDLAIYNLGKDTAQKAFKRGDTLAIRAGYSDTIDFLFKGQIRNSFRERNGPDVPTRVLARGGSLPKSSVEKTLGEGAPVVSIIQECATAMGYPLIINAADFASVPVYPRGYSLHGDPRVYLDNLAQTHGFKYLIENDRLIVNKDEGFREGNPFVVSQFTGMEGIPEISEVGCDVSMRLTPKIRVFGRIQVESELKTFNFSNLYFQNIPEQAGSGIYRVLKLRHSGDSHGDKWTTEINGIR